jgi:tetratricopeptide (TPR) repeat protein
MLRAKISIRMKIFLTLVFLILIVSSALAQLAQLKQTDSLKHQLRIARHDTIRVLIFAELAEAYRYRIPDSALIYGQRSLSLARQIKFSKGEVNALLSISVVMRELGNFPKALETGLKALQIAQDDHYNFGEVRSLVRIGNVHVASNNFRIALDYYRQAEKKLEIFPDHFHSTVVQVWSGIAYEALNILDSALYYEQLASKEIYRYETLPPQYFRVLGNIQAKSGNSDLALQYYQQGIQSVLKNNNYRDAAPLYISIASLYKKLNQTDSAIRYAKQGLAYGQLLAYKIRIMDASSLLAELYEQKDIKTSLQYYKIATAAKDSMYGVEQVQALQSIAYNEQERKRR